MQPNRRKKYQESLGGRNVVIELSMLAASVLACVFNAERQTACKRAQQTAEMEAEATREHK